MRRKSFLKNSILSDLDIVNHVNVKYLEWCLDMVDENIINQKKLILK
jgi:acyl-ACP thioesterase